ncbi:protein kinase [Nonomuraea sp. NPDC050394]|uniref:protein kinase domain-containing protein n=1 Tax=Nonomuraea sp. NPDC050394 TaxID=3364363 RepID=UPI00379EDDA8
MIGEPDGPFAVSVPSGYRVGDWEVRHPLATGAFSSVYLAHRVGAHDELPAMAALKFLPTGTGTPRRLRHYQDLVRREVELHRSVDRPRLIRMFQTLVVDDAGQPELDGATVLVLERAESSLAALISLLSLVAPAPVPGGPMVLAQVCEGLADLHAAGWVHGDLKPGNVLLMADGSVRLGDFNLAAEMEGTHAYAPAFSTPDYTAPELLWSEIGERGQVIRPSADVWAFGIMAHLLLTGAHPFPGGTPSARRDAVQAYGRGAERLRLSPDLPEPWRQIVRDCLARTHEERAAHTSAALLPRVASAAAATTPRRRRRPRLLMVTAAALVVGALAGFGAAGLREPPGTTGYYRCPENSACFFSENDGKGEMCSWTEASEDWAAGPGRCAWALTQPVKSVFNNANELDPYHALAFYMERDHQRRKGCTSVHAQGNLAGTYMARSHQWLTRC